MRHQHVTANAKTDDQKRERGKKGKTYPPLIPTHQLVMAEIHSNKN
jgi:hypothetical protein